VNHILFFFQELSMPEINHENWKYNPTLIHKFEIF